MPAGTVIGNPAWWANRIARQYRVRSGITHPHDASARDAERYRWLRDNRRAAIPEFQSGWDVIEYVDGGEREYINSAQSLDDAIDAAMSAAAREVE